MKCWKKCQAIGLGVLFMALVLSNPAGAINLSFVAQDSEIQVGDQISIDIVVSELDDYVIAGFDFFVNFDDSILDFNSYVLGEGLGDLSLFDSNGDPIEAEDWSELNGVPAYTLGSGQIHLAEFSWLLEDALASLQGDPSFTLATILLTGSGVGYSELSFSSEIAGEFCGANIPVTPYQGSVDVSAVPEPSTCLLLGFGLLAMIGLRKKFSKT